MANSLSVEDYRKIFVDNSTLLEPQVFDHVVKIAEQTRRPLEQLLMERAFIAPHQLLQLTGDYFGVPTTPLRINDIKREALELVPERFASQFLAIPFDADEKTIKVALVNPKNEEVLAALQSSSHLEVKPYVATEHSVRRALILYDGDIKEILEKIIAKAGDEARTGEKAAPFATALVGAIVETAVMMEASDVHIEPFEDETIVRYRIDGVLRSITRLPTKLHQSIVAYLKVEAKLRVDQKRLPQDGRFSLMVKGQEVNVRMSTVPSLWGEKTVLRILPKEAHLFDLGNVGFLDSDLEIIRKYLKRPFGMILVCGPTGSGKTTTLYSFLQEIGTERIDVVNISTIEDPIEYTVPRVTQIQTQTDIDLTFAAGLRALLRQDPDIIMVGEIRDTETASFAVRASLVGRLVLSSLHTNDAVGAIPRLLDMGVEPYLVSSTLAIVIAQRLARRLCLYCRASYKPDASTIKDLTDYHNLNDALKTLAKIGIISKPTSTDIRFFKAVGCERCGGSGYSGRTGIFEIMEMSDDLRRDIADQKDSGTLHQTALNGGMKTMFADGLAKVILGQIDLDELLRAAYN